MKVGKNNVESKEIEEVMFDLFVKYLLQLKFPITLYVEPTNDCDLNCIMCPRAKSRRKIGYMKFGLFKRIIDESVKYSKRDTIVLHKDGEPLLHPLITKMIKYAKEREAANIITLNTNATKLNEIMSKKILNSGLDRLVISLDGVTKQTYEKIRRGSNYELIERNIMEFLKLKKELKLEKPKVVLQIINMKETEPEINLFQKKWSSWVDEVEIKDFLTWAGSFNRDNDISSGNSLVRNPCMNLWTHLAINWDGDVSICCLDFDKKGVIGNVQKGSLYHIWNGEELQKIRLYHLRGEYHKIPLCSECKDWKLNRSVWSKENIEIFIKHYMQKQF
jgi:radical SAM protein with 4Fe4S-binding SPASM domain